MNRLLLLSALLAATASALPVAAQGPAALAFDGVDDYVDVGTHIPLMRQNFTIEFWMRTSSSATGMAAMEHNLGYDNGFMIGTNMWGELGEPGRVYFSTGGPPQTETISQTVVTDGVWHHVACVYDTTSGEKRLYVDGQLDATTLDIGERRDAFNELYIGGFRDRGYILSFPGDLDEFRVWGVARTEAEIQAAMSTPLVGHEAGLLLYYRFDEGAGGVAMDAAGTRDGFLGESTAAPNEQAPTWIPAGPVTAPLYAVTAPTASTLTEVGTKVLVQWSGPGVDPAPGGPNNRYIDIYGRQGNGPSVLLADNVRNTGSRKIVLPLDTQTGSDYAISVVNEANPARFGVSASTVVYGPDQLFTFTTPRPQQDVARGQTFDVTWVSPAGAPSWSEVTLTLYSSRTGEVQGSVTVPNSGSYAWSFPSDLDIRSYYFTIQSEYDPVYGGRSEPFNVGRVQVDEPMPWTVWTTGEWRAVRWSGPTTNPAATVKVLLRRAGFPNVVLATNVAYVEGSVTVNVPPVASGADYYIQLMYKQVSGVVVPYQSATFTLNNLTSPVTPAAAAGHFRAPVPATQEEMVLAVTAAGLADGDEVAAFAGDLLLASGVVAGGHVDLFVPNAVADAAELALTGDPDAAEVTVALDAPLSLRAYTAGHEVPLVVTHVTSPSEEEGASRVGLTGLTFTEGVVLSVEATTGAPAASSAGVPSAFALEAPYPNPFSASTTLRFALPAPEHARVTVHDALGREVAVLAEGVHDAGYHTVRFDGSALPSGVYSVRMAAGAFAATRRLTLVK